MAQLSTLGHIRTMTTDSINQRTKEIGAILIKLFQAEGRGLHELITSCEKRLSPLALCGLRRVATIRNRLFHEESFTIDKVPEDFDALCKELIEYIPNSVTPQRPEEPPPRRDQTAIKTSMQGSDSAIDKTEEVGKVCDLTLTPEQKIWYEKYSRRRKL